MFKQKKVIALAVIILAVTVTGVFAWKPFNGPPDKNSGTAAVDKAEAKAATPEEVRQEAKKAGANELAQIPVFVYHLIDKEERR